jgi:enterochelin esterase-like enzyme
MAVMWASLISLSLFFGGVRSFADELSRNSVISLSDVGSKGLVEAAPLSRSTATTRAFVTDLVDPEGKPAMVQYRVILPKGFDPSKKYPVVYFLHGYGDNMEMIEREGALSVMDSLVDSGKSGFIIVSPSGGTEYWMNGFSNGLRWEDVVTGPLIENFEANYPSAKTSPMDRVLAGISMGGSSAVRIAMDHPGLYGAVAGHSPVFRDEKAAQEFPEIYGKGKDYAARDPFSLAKAGKQIPAVIRLDGGFKSAVDLHGRARDFAEEFHIPSCALHFSDTDGDHADSYWSKHLPEYFDWYSRYFDQTQVGALKNPDCP